MSERPGAADVRGDMRDALKRTAVALKDSGLPFALGGGYAAWARGGPEPDHDVDFLVAEADAEKATDALREHGFRIESPPEDWLVKAFCDDAMVDVLFRIANDPVDVAVLERGGELEVLSVRMPVLGATDLLVSKLMALSENDCDLGRVLPVARALREQVDWSEVRRRTSGNPVADACLYLLERLQVIGSA
jgi:hypothetical protein